MVERRAKLPDFEVTNGETHTERKSKAFTFKKEPLFPSHTRSIPSTTKFIYKSMESNRLESPTSKHYSGFLPSTSNSKYIIGTVYSNSPGPSHLPTVAIWKTRPSLTRTQ